MSRALAALPLVSLTALTTLAPLLSACGDAPPTPPATPATAPAASAADASAPAPPATTPDADYRQKAPTPGPDVTFTPPRIQELTLSNKIRVLLVERHELPIVAIRVASDLGADHAAPGVGAFAGALQLAGTKTRSALDISDAFRSLGGEFGGFVDYDGSYLQTQVLSSKVSEGLALLADVAEHPTFPKEEVERERSRRLTTLAQERDSPQLLLGNVVAGVLYPPTHPYSTPLIGNEELVKRVTARDLIAFHDATMEPDHVTIALAGDITADQAKTELERAFGTWRGAARKDKPPVEQKPELVKKLRDACATLATCGGVSHDARVVIMDRPNSSQSNVAVVHVGEPRLTRDYDALLVMNTILGGMFSSRLNMNLREAHAYTYGANSGFDLRHGPGPFRAGGAIVRESTAPAVKEILAEIDRLRREPVTDDELSGAKSSLIKSLPARFETADGTAGTLASLAVYGLPLDEFATRPARLARVTKEDVLRVAKEHLVPERFRVVIVGDASKIKDSLVALNIGPVAVTTPARISAVTAAQKIEDRR